MRRSILYPLMGVLAAAGLAVLFYPSISGWYNARYQIRAIVSYDDSIENMSEQMIAQELEKAFGYNQALAGQVIADPFIPGGVSVSETYMGILNTNNGMMGSIRIPVIQVNLPIYHGTSAEVLAKGVGHMEMTPFPIGGEGNHSVLTGHTALPDARLFTDLDRLREGDVFYLHIYKMTLAYQVDQITVVTPENTTPLIPEAGQDHVTLVTCTPYGINSHRLLVRGVRIPYEAAEKGAQQETAGGVTRLSMPYDLVLALAMLALVIVMLLWIVITKMIKRRDGSGKDE